MLDRLEHPLAYQQEFVELIHCTGKEKCLIELLFTETSQQFQLRCPTVGVGGTGIGLGGQRVGLQKEGRYFHKVAHAPRLINLFADSNSRERKELRPGHYEFDAGVS